MGVDKFLRNIIAKGVSTLVGSVSTGHLTVKSGTAFTGPTTFTGSLNVTGPLKVLGNLTVNSRFLGVQGLTQGVASVPVGSTYVIITTGAVSSQSAIIPQIVTDIASTRLLDTFIGSITVGTGFAITLSAPAAEATDVRWLIVG